MKAPSVTGKCIFRFRTLTSASVQFVMPPAERPLIVELTAEEVGATRFSAIEALVPYRTIPTSSVEPSATTALLSPTKNCFSQPRIGEQPVPLPPAVLPEVSMT